MKSRKGTLTQKMPFAARFSCCASHVWNNHVWSNFVSERM